MRLIIVGTGNMARAHAEAFRAIDGVDLVGAVEIDPDRRAAFSDAFQIDKRFASIEDVLEWGGFDAVCNVTPDAVHHATTMPFLRAGKHVFCEKPLATDYPHAAEMTQAAQAAGVTNMVNLTYRNVAALQKARQMIADGQIGAIRHIEASYLQSWLTQPAWGDWKTESTWLWRLSTQHGSHGALGDVGVHIVDFASFAAGQEVVTLSANLQTFHKAPGDKIGEYPLDANDSFTMSAEFSEGALAVIHASRFASGHINRTGLRIFGTDGGIEITNDERLGSLRHCLGADMSRAVWTEAELAPVPTNYERFAQAVRTGQPDAPDFAHAARLQAVLDAAQISDAQKRRVAVAEITA